MCGLAGFIDTSGEKDNQQLAALASRMAETLSHRGPDDEAAWTDAQAGVALGFRRLAVLDLSENGRQPMLSACERFVVVFNGEIYNHRELRKQLEADGHGFRGSSDTEVLLAAIGQWGLHPAVQRFNGMFALALWDRHERQLHLVRDRLGEKPLYYGWMGSTFLFGSELKALKAHPAFQGTVNRSALALYFRHNCVPAPYSIYEGILKLAPGTILSLDLAKGGPHPSFSQYWSAKEAALSGLRSPFCGSEEDAVDELEIRLGQSVRSRMVADVPLGAFLSGGVDSSLVVALMQSHSTRPVRTFCIGSPFDDYNESNYARAVSGHLGTAHTELTVTGQDTLAVIPQLAGIFDEPFADSSQIPTLLVSRLARREVTVSLSGDGGDELFGGYNRYVWGSSLWKRLAPIPLWLRSCGAAALHALSPRFWQHICQLAKPVLPAQFHQKQAGDKLQKLATALSAESPEHLYVKLASHWENPALLVLGATEPLTPVTDPEAANDYLQLPERMMFLDTISYLPDDILVKLDRASMAVGLEARTPLLDHTLLEFAWSLPLSLKIREKTGKFVLRQVLYRHVPASLLNRPKAGFSIPLDAWLRGPLRDWAEELLNERSLRVQGYLDPSPVRTKWQQHLSGKRNWQYPIWDVLMFQAWLAEDRKLASA